MNIFLCGTGYGAVYLPIVVGSPELCLVGIFSRGSDRSIEYARRLSVPSYTVLESIPTDSIDLAIVAVSGIDGVNIARSLIERGVNVIVEHPIEPSHYNELYSNLSPGQYLFVNSHFRYTEEISQFINVIKTSNLYNLNSVVASASYRTLFSMLDILSDCFGKLNFNEIKKQGDNKYQQWILPFEYCSVFLNYQAWRSSDDDGSDVCMGHSIQAFYNDRTVQLVNTWGPVVQQSQPAEGSSVDLCSASIGLNDLNSIMRIRRSANQKFIMDSISSIDTGKVLKEQEAEHIREVSEIWKEIRFSEREGF